MEIEVWLDCPGANPKIRIHLLYNSLYDGDLQSYYNNPNYSVYFKCK